ncbi:PR domain zinc finger protein 5-like [Trichoplusia ni]|uniref:PR domain zinc finger protein 5-like n=1 Tax=Trichoplusia ni TaxID=7111 RepID=A0A7E5WUH1_TRINI|nr:PR domain zinc finger protein 5-like [Trichoplusia ni]
MIEKHFCQCCLSEECYKDMKNVYYRGQKPENYGDMLTNIFNITISKTDDGRCFICEECVSRLRDAAAFKEQVISTQEAILQKLAESNSSLKTGPILECKLEDESDDFDDHISDSFVWAETEDTHLQGQTFVIQLEPRTKLPITDEAKKESNGVKQNLAKEKNMAVKKSNLNKKAKQPSVKRMKEKLLKTTPPHENLTHSRENTLKLVQNSNLCLFRSLQNKYGCCLCNKSFSEMIEFRNHFKTHCDSEKFSKVQKLRGLSYKNAEISNLECSICQINCLDFNELMAHLINKHEISFQGKEHFLIPFKLLDKFKCVLCDLQFNSYLRLAIHMHSHYKYNVCERCGQCFINRLSLRTHIHSMHKQKKCSKCPAIFVTNSAKVKHLRTVHNIHNSKRYCNLCNLTFRYTYMLQEHKIQDHGLERPVSNCMQCGKTFLSATNLKLHIRSVHIKERNFPCLLCSMRFFTKCDQKRHERTHQDVRSFTCDFCGCRFKSKDSWRRHLKRQHGHDSKDSSKITEPVKM